MNYVYISQNRVVESPKPPPGAQPFADRAGALLPPQISTLHDSFFQWGKVGYAPGPIVPGRLWIGPDDSLVVHCADGDELAPYTYSGYVRDLAAWLVLLDTWMETFVVIARARSTWPAAELASALPFATPAYLPPSLLADGRSNWQRVAQALAATAADGPLKGRPEDRHWKEIMPSSHSN